ncbi:WD repeat-containing protein 83 [Homalodisca vitripennis]|nr:WD repeat-containing protein 83 [Homalodisca vitripennis]
MAVVKDRMYPIGYITVLKHIMRQMRYSGHQTGDYVMECGVDQSDRHVVSGAVDGSVWWWELVQAKVTHRLAHSPCRPVTSLSVHPTQPRLLSAAANTINLWSATEPD